MPSGKKKMNSMLCQVCGIQHFSPWCGFGLRTTIYFAGCPLSCPWCSNPEGRLASPAPVFNPDRCISPHCDACIRACPERAIFRDKSRIGIARDCCDSCGKCAQCCPSGAIFMSGRAMTPADIMAEVLKDEPYLKNGGGISLSGGEPFMHPDRIAAVLRLAGQAGLHRAVESCGFFDMDAPRTREALGETDLLLFDLKHSNPQVHRQHTGVDNSRILANLGRLRREFPRLEVCGRTLLVPGFNDDPSVLREIAAISGAAGIRRHMLIPFSPLCRDKYLQLGQPCGNPGHEPSPRLMERAAAIFAEAGLETGC